MTTFVLPSEISPVAMRTTGHGISAGIGPGAFIGVFLFPLLQTSLGLRGTLLLTAAPPVSPRLISSQGIARQGGSPEGPTTLEDAPASVPAGGLSRWTARRHIARPG